MRLKTFSLCCAFAWSPASLGTPAMVAAASFSGATPDDFDSSAYLELLLADVTKTDQTEMPVVGRISLPDRACRVDWSSHTGQQGIIAVACANGKVYLYSAAAVLKAGPNGGDGSGALVATIRHHTASVRACQFNVSQPHFLATGDDNGEWFLWNLPRPGAPEWHNLQPLEIMRDKKHSHPVVHLQWHPRYPHIIATAASNGTVNAWNLRTESLVTSLSVYKASRGAGATCIAWNPTAATQLAVGLDDPHPVVQIWDLKCSMSPVRELVGHTRGVSGVAWSTQDASMLASCGGDGRTIWWDPASGANCGELQPEPTFVVDVQWCPVLRGVLATSSFAPLLCVSTAQPSGAAVVGGGGGGTVGAADGGGGSGGGGIDGVAAGRASHAGIPKWLIPPCRASVNFALVVASLTPGSETRLQLTQVEGSAPMSPKSSLDEQRKQELLQCPPGSDERVAWLQEHQHPLLAAVASSRNDRQPILAYLARSEEVEHHQQQQSGSVGGSLEDDDDPFAQISQEQQKTYEERASEHVCNGRIEEAVEVCLDSGRYADAYTLAFLRGGAMIAKVHQRYVQYVAAEHQERRHVLIAGAIASGDYRKLVEQQVPWQEVLSTIIAYVVDNFADSCNQLGDCLKDAGNYDGAYACYVCGRNVDGVVELWRLQGVPSRTLVQNTILLEETTERPASSRYFAQCLCDYGLKLVNEGHPNEAASYLNRAARIGDPTATVLVDRMSHILNIGGGDNSATNQAPPFQVTPIADQPSPACSEFINRQHERHMQQQQQQQQKQQQQQQPQQQQMSRRPSITGGGVPPPPQSVQMGAGCSPAAYQGATRNSPNPALPTHAPPQQQQQPTPMQPPMNHYASHANVNQQAAAPGGGAFVPPPMHTPSLQSQPQPQQQQQQQQQQLPQTPNRGAGGAPPSVSSSNLHPSVAPNRPPLVASSAPLLPSGGDYRHHNPNANRLPPTGGAPPPPPPPGGSMGGAGQQQQQQQQFYPPPPQPQTAPAPVAAKTPVGPPPPRLMPHPVSGYSSMRAPSSAVPPPPPPRGSSLPSSTAGSFVGSVPPSSPGSVLRGPPAPGSSQPPPPPQQQPMYGGAGGPPPPMGRQSYGQGPPQQHQHQPPPPQPPQQQQQYPRY